jgi:hypothetical protein
MIMIAQTAAKPRPANETAKAATASAPEDTKERKTYNTQVFTSDFLSNPLQATEDEIVRAAPTRERSEQQKAVDKVIPQLHAAWVAAGKPTNWTKMRRVIAKYPVAPENAAALKYLIRRAADLHGLRAKFGSAVRTKDGKEIVAFAIMDKRPRETSKA